MTDSRLSRLAWVITGGGLLLLGLAMVFIVLNIPAGPLPNENAWYDDLLITASLSVAIIVGGFVAARQPRNPYGWLLLVFGISNGAVQGLAEGYAIFSFKVAPAPLPFVSLSFVLVAMAFATWISIIPLLFLLFPSGRLPSKRWWPLAGLIAAAYLVMVLFLWRSPSATFMPLPNPFQTSGATGQWIDNAASAALTFILFVAIPAGALSVIVRAWRAKGAERQQFKWLGLASLLLLAAFFLNSEVVPLLPGTLDALLEAAAYAGVPLAVGLAVLRYRLWDIDVIIRKTALYAVLSVLLGVVYAVLVVLLQALFSRTTGQNSPFALVLSTLAIAALFTPLRRRVQGQIDRRFYRRKYDAEQVLNRFSQTVRDETDLDKLTAELLSVIQETMQPEFVTLWLKPAEQRPPVTGGGPSQH